MKLIMRIGVLLVGAIAQIGELVYAEPPLVVSEERHHLRSGDEREWTSFPEKSEGDLLALKFEAKKNLQEHALFIRHRDVRQVWNVVVNGKQVGKLRQDENPMIGSWALPPGTLTDGENRLEISTKSKNNDDIEVGPIRLINRPVQEAKSEATVEITVNEAPSGKPIPARLTIVDESGALAAVGAKSGAQLAVRTGVIYTGDGLATFGLPAGRYQVVAGHGFEYEMEGSPLELNLREGDSTKVECSIRRTVKTPGLVACDTHVHTVTYSGHGDATIDERMITLAAEGIELPIATDHNTHTNYEPASRQSGMRRHFTPVIGNEVTTKHGHFNIFPIDPAAPVPDHGVTEWSKLIPSLFKTPNVQIVILNHGRDRHAGFRPFEPENFNEAVGWNFVGDEIAFNAMEVVNSAAPQTDPFELFRDWMSLLNRGYRITPIGSSDSHDVNRYIVGQGRTYVECDDNDPARIDVAAACRSLREGRVRVSCGLLVDLKVNSQHGPGDLVTGNGKLQFDVQVKRPKWTTATHVALFANGVRIRRENLQGQSDSDGSTDDLRWTIDRPAHDVFVTALAWGPRIENLAWPLGQPYQADGPDWTGNVIGLTGAVWIDGDGDGKFTSAFEYAKREVTAKDASISKLLPRLAKFDESVAAQGASLLHEAGADLESESNTRLLKSATPHVRAGFKKYLEAWDKCRRAGANL